jgi:hypothetical protein
MGGSDSNASCCSIAPEAAAVVVGEERLYVRVTDSVVVVMGYGDGLW